MGFSISKPHPIENAPSAKPSDVFPPPTGMTIEESAPVLVDVKTILLSVLMDAMVGKTELIAFFTAIIVVVESSLNVTVCAASPLSSIVNVLSPVAIDVSKIGAPMVPVS